MGRYFWIQCKRLSRMLPGAVLATLILLGGLLLVFRLTVEQDSQTVEKQRFRVAMVGYTDDPYLQLGLSAMTGFDSSRMTLDIQMMEQTRAKQALRSGLIAAYVEIPEGFMDEAMVGNILPLKFVTTTGAAGLTSIIKDEITTVISTVLRHTQKGVYGMEHAVRDNGQYLGNNMNVMALQYTEYVLARDKLYAVEQLGIGDALGLEGYLLCGLSVLFLLLCCLPYGAVLIRRDLSLQRMLCAKGKSAFGQAVAEFGAYFLCLLGMLLMLLVGAALFTEEFPFFAVLWRVGPVVLMTAAFSYMVYSLSTDLTGGILLLFFSGLVLCFVSGCLYPVYMFPVRVQQVAAWLPTGMARSLLAGSITGQKNSGTALYLTFYAVAFFLAGSTVSCRRIKGVGR